MRIEAISMKVPSRKMSNEQILEEIKKYNVDRPPDIVKRYQKQVLYLLNKAGSKTRYWRDKEKNETAIQFIKNAISNALNETGMKKSEIDMMIYCGVGRGFLEPANAYFCAEAMGMNCHCFDVIDACMSWVRSLDIAYNYLKTKKYKKIMIVNAEFVAYEYGYPNLFKINSLKQIEYTFPVYTIGEAATATILSNSNHKWNFDYDSVPDLGYLCSIPMKNYEEFHGGNEYIGLNGIDGFVSFGIKLYKVAIDRIVNLHKKIVKDIDKPDLWFPHAAALNASIEAANILGIKPDKLYSKVFPDYGNVVSASIPLGMHLAIKEKRLVRGNRVILAPVSAGMSFAIVQFEY